MYFSEFLVVRKFQWISELRQHLLWNQHMPQWTGHFWESRWETFNLVPSQCEISHVSSIISTVQKGTLSSYFRQDSLHLSKRKKGRLYKKELLEHRTNEVLDVKPTELFLNHSHVGWVPSSVGLLSLGDSSADRHGSSRAASAVMESWAPCTQGSVGHTKRTYLQLR